MLTKEKSKQKRKGVNNQNNSVELFPVINTIVTSSYFYLFFNQEYSISGSKERE